MLSRVAGRALTGPLAFFAAGLVDISLLLVVYVRWRIDQRRRRAAG
jgi:hypothetical protein